MQLASSLDTCCIAGQLELGESSDTTAVEYPRTCSGMTPIATRERRFSSRMSRSCPSCEDASQPGGEKVNLAVGYFLFLFCLAWLSFCFRVLRFCFVLLCVLHVVGYFAGLWRCSMRALQAAVAGFWKISGIFKGSATHGRVRWSRLAAPPFFAVASPASAVERVQRSAESNRTTCYSYIHEYVKIACPSSRNRAAAAVVRRTYGARTTHASYMTTTMLIFLF